MVFRIVVLWMTFLPTPSLWDMLWDVLAAAVAATAEHSGVRLPYKVQEDLPAISHKSHISYYLNN